jgi:hypothetical protein
LRCAARPDELADRIHHVLGERDLLPLRELADRCRDVTHARREVLRGELVQSAFVARLADDARDLSRPEPPARGELVCIRRDPGAPPQQRTLGLRRWRDRDGIEAGREWQRGLVRRADHDRPRMRGDRQPQPILSLDVRSIRELESTQDRNPSAQERAPQLRVQGRRHRRPRARKSRAVDLDHGSVSAGRQRRGHAASPRAAPAAHHEAQRRHRRARHDLAERARRSLGQPELLDRSCHRRPR